MRSLLQDSVHGFANDLDVSFNRSFCPYISFILRKLFWTVGEETFNFYYGIQNVVKPSFGFIVHKQVVVAGLLTV